jgi:RNA polymerase sigma-70 factor (sigma-E family)
VCRPAAAGAAGVRLARSCPTLRVSRTSRSEVRLARGKGKQFEAFAEAQEAGLFRLAYSLCGDRERSQDAVQEALAQVYQRWSRLRDPLAYARRVAVNATRADWHRSSRQGQITDALAREPAAESAAPEDLVLDRDALMAALDQLPERQRAVVVLRYGSQLSEVETASVLEIPLGTVKTHTRRALARMRETLSSAELDRHCGGMRDA